MLKALTTRAFGARVATNLPPVWSPGSATSMGAYSRELIGGVDQDASVPRWQVGQGARGCPATSPRGRPGLRPPLGTVPVDADGPSSVTTSANVD